MSQGTGGGAWPSAASVEEKKQSSAVDIFITEKNDPDSNGRTQIRVPWLPASIEYAVGEKVFATYDIINRGEVAVPTGTGLARISWVL